MTATDRPIIDSPVANDRSAEPGRPGCAIALVASTEPSVVFTSLAARCAEQVCDDCTVDLVDGGAEQAVDGRGLAGDPTRDEPSAARYRIVRPSPPATSGGGLHRLTERAATAPSHVLQVPFEHRPVDASHGDGFRGEATFVWHRRCATHADRVLVGVLVDHAVATVAAQRSAQIAAAATSQAEHLTVALRTSRQIGAAVGILMSQHKITDDDAFDMLRRASQRTNRKLRDLARDVIDTGWLDPTVQTHDPVPLKTQAFRDER